MLHGRTRSWRRSVLRGALALLSAALAGSLAAHADVPFADLGQAFLARHGKAAKAEDLPVEELREAWCVHGELGAFDVAYPLAALADKSGVDELKTLCSSLLELQAHWIEWLAQDAAKAEAARADIAVLQAWIKGWKPAGFARAAQAADKDLFVLLSANEAQVAAAGRLGELVCKADVLGIAPREGRPLRILFAPTRRDFVELLAYAGLLDETKRAELWQAFATEWTTFWIGWDIVMACQYPAWSQDPEFRTGLPMDKFDKSGLEQHTVQQAANGWQWLCFGADGAPYLHQAVAMNLAISVCGELNALEGDGWGFGTTGGETKPYEKFVPGGNSGGGVLPPIPAASQDSLKKGRWREGLGKDHFAAPLRKGQKNGLKALAKDKPAHLDDELLRDKDAHFLLVSADDSVKYVVSAPFFGPEARSKPYPPTAVILDYREFFRAYKCAFFHWLQTQAVPKDPAASAERFRKLLRALSERGADTPLEDLVREIHELPLSAANGKTESLEWRFLEWLAKGK